MACGQGAEGWCSCRWKKSRRPPTSIMVAKSVCSQRHERSKEESKPPLGWHCDCHQARQHNLRVRHVPSTSYRPGPPHSSASKDSNLRVLLVCQDKEADNIDGGGPPLQCCADWRTNSGYYCRCCPLAARCHNAIGTVDISA